MELDYTTIVVSGLNRWIVWVDGVAEPGIGYGTRQLAFKRMDELWDKRPEADKTMEALYTGE